ncbi:MAG: 16S rRNA (cytosine(1402)-N(4))-methyltransferase RsmH [Bacteroidales bacterium]|nr:16S rRNA (cytosine(1402)-N(4))-methyltransferase RsmH [Bacteroidales bacterium]MCF8454327.1 16S rRNA (cytosine(1402)-N(4))-methyltransferase RsmH [Bacteroidales bacterium]
MTVYHIPALLAQSINGLSIKPDGVYVDVTYGAGGHSKEIFKNLLTGKLIAFDQDTDACRNLIENERFFFANHNFKYLLNFLNYFGFDQVDGIIADLGVSFHHFDQAERGFSIRFDGPLDMRMNSNSKITAAEILNTYSFEKLAGLFRTYGDIPNAGKLSGQIVSQRDKSGLTRTGHLIEIAKNCTQKKNENKFLAKVFQALRIEVNQEIEALKDFLLQASEALKPGGRLVVISYHSLEDKLVKNFMKTGTFGSNIEKDIYGNSDCPFKLIGNKVIVPDEAEIEENKRSRSAKLRIAEKI